MPSEDDYLQANVREKEKKKGLPLETGIARVDLARETYYTRIGTLLGTM